MQITVDSKSRARAGPAGREDSGDGEIFSLVGSVHSLDQECVRSCRLDQLIKTRQTSIQKVSSGEQPPGVVHPKQSVDIGRLGRSETR
jgi:hypothetical protein